MKVNLFMFFISLVISGLIFFGFYTWADGNLLYSLGTAIISFALLLGATSISDPDASRGNAMLKTTSWIFFLSILVIDILLAVFKASVPAYVIINGVLLCIWAVIIYGIAKAKQ